MKKSHWLIVLYLLLIVFPVLLVTFWGPDWGHPFFYELGKNFALMGFMLLALQFVLAGRLKGVERPFGFDILIRFHKYMGILAVLLLVGHPLLLALGGGGLRLLISLDMPWYILLAKVVLLLLFLNVVVSLYGERFRLKFERWRLLHDILGPTILILGFLHSRRTGSDFSISLLEWYWAIVFTLALAVFIYHRWIRSWRLGRHRWLVTEVKKEVERVWTVKLEPPQGPQVFDYVPGQFQFITLHRARGLPVEEHHWTISSSPAQRAYVTSTIKELGDFTATIGRTEPGDTAVVEGPFGRFSYLLRPGKKDLVFIAGGIGITPLMSMLRYMRDTKADISVLLIYANRNEGDIVFRQEIEEIATEQSPQLQAIHLLSQPGPEWAGESGRLDRAKLERYCQGRVHDRTFYLCGPPPMIAAVLKILRDSGVPDERIETEVFSFLG